MAYLKSTGLTNKVEYPVGHVIGSAMGTPSTTTYNGTDMTDITCTNWTASITKKLGAASAIYLLASYQFTIYQGNVTNPAKMEVYFNRTAPTSANFGDDYWYMRTEGGGNQLYRNWYGKGSLSIVDTSSATGTHTYIGHVKPGNPDSGTPSGGIDGSGESTMILFEVVE